MIKKKLYFESKHDEWYLTCEHFLNQKRKKVISTKIFKYKNNVFDDLFSVSNKVIRIMFVGISEYRSGINLERSWFLEGNDIIYLWNFFSFNTLMFFMLEQQNTYCWNNDSISDFGSNRVVWRSRFVMFTLRYCQIEFWDTVVDWDEI